MAVVQTVNQTALGKERLVDRWTEKANVQGLVEAIMQNIQVIESIYRQLLDERSVYTAIGVQLDNIGVIVGEARAGKDDGAYRQSILNQIAINAADGTAESILSLLRVITQSSQSRIFEHYPAALIAHVNGTPTNEAANTLQGITSAGVHSVLSFDGGVNTFVGAAATTTTSSLVLENLDELVVENGDELVVTDVTVYPEGDRSFLPHLLDTQLINPLCGLFDGRTFITEVGQLVDQDDNTIVFENNDELTYQIIEEA